MELRDQTVVVTGGGSGIGAAMARRFAEEGAAGVAVADIDGAAAERVASSLGERGLSVGGDVADPGVVDGLVTAVEERFGPIDLFCANAGVAVGRGLGEPDEWVLALEVNIRAHVVAARRLLPGWLERGSGWFLATASAAGLLSQIGSAPYAVTKHAAVGFAEWLSITYAERGVGASCLCPMGVRTPLLEGGLDAGELGANVVAAAGELLEPEQVADAVVQGLRDERFLILPHPEVGEFFARKGSDYERWIRGMRRLQARVDQMG